MQTLRRCFCFIFALVLLVGINPLATQASISSFSDSLPLTIVHQPVLAPLAVPGSGIDCDCMKTGDYVDPKNGVSPKWKQGETVQDGTSPNGVYKFTWSGLDFKTITVSRVADNEVVLTVQDRADDWGFSPDDHRFVYWYIFNGQTHIRLINLEKQPGSPREWSYDQSAAAPDILFSPKGNYFFLATLTGTNNVSLLLLNALTAAQRYSAQFFFTNIPGGRGDKYGLVKFGFSPDNSDRTFVYGYVNGQNSVAWRMVNLEISSEITNLNIDGISAFWQFSKCGDLLGLVEETDPSHIQTSLYKTQNGALVYGSQKTFVFLVPVSLMTTNESHVANIGGTPNTLASNTAQAACPVEPVLDSISLDTARIVGGHPVNGTVRLTLPAPSGGATISLSSDDPAATVPASVDILEGSTSASFSVITGVVTEPVDVTIKASYKGEYVPILLHVTVVPPPLEAITLNNGFIESGKTLVVTVTLQSAALAGGVDVLLFSSHQDLVPLPENITIPAGKKSTQIIRGPFQVSTDTTVTLEAYLNGGEKIAKVILLPEMPDLEAFSFDPPSIIGGSSSLVTGTITLAANSPSNYLSVDLTTTDSSSLYFLPEMSIPKGKKTGTFFVSTFAGVAEPVTTTVTATLEGSTRSANIRVLPADLETFTIDPSCGVARQIGSPMASIAGHPIDAVVTLNGGAPPNGAVITLASSNPGLVPVPATMTVHGGGGSVTIPTSDVSKETIVTLTARYRDVTLQTPITLTVVPTYSFASMSLPFSPEYLNDEGQIAGESFIYHDGVIKDLKTEFNGLLGIIDMNEKGDVIVSGYIGEEHGLYYIEDDQPHIINPLEGFQDFVPEGMNDQGEVIGRACNSWPSYMCKGFTWKDGVTTELQYDPTRPVMLPQDINNQGVIVGYSDKKDDYNMWVSQMVEWVDKMLVPLGPYPVRPNQAIEINENSTIALHAGEPYTWNNGNLTMLGMPFSYDYTRIRALNDRDEVLITALVNGDIPIWKDAIHNEYGTYSLSCAFDLDEGWDALGIDINNNGQILGGIFQVDQGGGEWANQSEARTYYVFTPSEAATPGPKLFLPLVVNK